MPPSTLSSAMDPNTKRTLGLRGTLLMSAERRLSTIQIERGSSSSSMWHRLLPTKPAPPTTRMDFSLKVESLTGSFCRALYAVPPRRSGERDGKRPPRHHARRTN